MFWTVGDKTRNLKISLQGIVMAIFHHFLTKPRKFNLTDLFIIIVGCSSHIEDKVSNNKRIIDMGLN